MKTLLMKLLRLMILLEMIKEVTIIKEAIIVT